MTRPTKELRERIKSLKGHLDAENPLLVSAVDGFCELSKVGYATGLLAADESYTMQIPWWPLVSVLGTFSSGKSTFINHYLEYPLQDTGNQAVDDKFTVICYGSEKEVRVLPGLALDADPRFPFYQTSDELENVAPGEGRRIDSYLQLKACNAKNLKGKIFIDSPGFDADSQRSATLRLTNHIIDLSDLVLVLFDARHPEPGAMSDTLAHLVGGTVGRSDSSKFLYILNQIDTAAREDNPEEVVGAWQRALAREGLTSGRFYCIYNPDAAVPIKDQALRRRFEWKRDQDMSEISTRIEQVSVERSYRIFGELDKRATDIQDVQIGRIRELIRRWRRRVLRNELLGIGVLGAAVGGSYAYSSTLFDPVLRVIQNFEMTAPNITMLAAVAAVLLLGLHFFVRRQVARGINLELQQELDADDVRRMQRAFRKNSRFWRSLFEVEPVGWGRRNRRRVKRILGEADSYVQVLNDRFTDPSGNKPGASGKKADRPADAQQDEPEPPVVSGEVISGSRIS